MVQPQIDETSFKRQVSSDLEKKEMNKVIIKVTLFGFCIFISKPQVCFFFFFSFFLDIFIFFKNLKAQVKTRSVTE